MESKFDLNRSYIEPSGNFETFFDEGGYVFEFDSEKKLLMTKEERDDSGFEGNI